MAVVLLAAASLALSSYDFARPGSTVTSTQTLAMTVTSTRTSVSTTTQASAGRTITVLGTGTAQGQFDQSVVSLTANSDNLTVDEALQTIQARLTRTLADLQSSGLTNVQTGLGPISVASTTIFQNSTLTKGYSVDEGISLTLTVSTGGITSDLSQMAQIVVNDGLIPPTSQTSATASLQFSGNATARLTVLAFSAALANATSEAGLIAKAQGATILGQLAVTQVSNQQAPISLNSLLFPSVAGAATLQEVTVTVQATFEVSSA